MELTRLASCSGTVYCLIISPHFSFLPLANCAKVNLFQGVTGHKQNLGDRSTSGSLNVLMGPIQADKQAINASLPTKTNLGSF